MADCYYHGYSFSGTCCQCDANRRAGLEDDGSTTDEKIEEARQREADNQFRLPDRSANQGHQMTQPIDPMAAVKVLQDAMKQIKFCCVPSPGPTMRRIAEGALVATAHVEAQASEPAAHVPEGWKLVPIKPTEDMNDATEVRIGGCYSCSAQAPSWSECAEIYADMLAAAPAAPQVLPATEQATFTGKITFPKPTWQECEALSNVPLVNEALQAFADDRTGDNGVSIIVAVLEAIADQPYVNLPNVAPNRSASDQAYFLRRANHLIDDAQLHGFVVTMRTVPKLPLAMGNYDVIADVRPDHASYRGTK